jgi:hypothetical protein
MHLPDDVQFVLQAIDNGLRQIWAVSLAGTGICGPA